MLSTEVFYQNRRWWFAVIEIDRLGQVLERPILRRCFNRKDAYRQACEALKLERNKHNAA